MVNFCHGKFFRRIDGSSIFKIPTINIGDRQKSRFMHKSVICCNDEYSNIHKAVKKAISKSFSKSIKDKLHFGDGKAADQIVKV